MLSNPSRVVDTPARIFCSVIMRWKFDDDGGGGGGGEDK